MDTNYITFNEVNYLCSHHQFNQNRMEFVLLELHLLKIHQKKPQLCGEPNHLEKGHVCLEC